MASLQSHDFPSEVGLGMNVRDSGTINIVFPPTSIGITLENTDGPWRWSVYNVVLEQGNQQQLIGELDVSRRMGLTDFLFGDWDTLRVTGRTRDDSLRIIGQLNPDRGWSINGLGPGEAEWVIQEEGGGVVDRFPLTLTGGPPTLDDVVVESIAPEQVAPFTAGGTFTVASPITRGAEADVEVTLEDAESGRRVGIQTFPISIPGAVRLGAVNRSEFELPTSEFVEGRDLRICAELVDVRVP